MTTGSLFAAHGQDTALAAGVETHAPLLFRPLFHLLEVSLQSVMILCRSCDETIKRDRVGGEQACRGGDSCCQFVEVDQEEDRPDH